MKSSLPNRQINNYHKNQIRITGGQLRGRKIQFPNIDGLRPTPDSVRERLFNWLGQDLTGQTVLDLFAGSGALGFESVSRHARQVVMCDIHRAAVQNLHHHAQQFQADSRVQIYQQDGLQWIERTEQLFDLILLDPPFAWQDWGKLLPLLIDKLMPDGLVYIELGKLPEIPGEWEVVKQGKAGQSLQLLLRRLDKE